MTEGIPNPSPCTTIEDEVHYCAVHPKRDTELRCNRCERYMCIECAKRTPVGYTCHDCVRGHEDKFYEGTTIDYAVVATVAVVGGAIASFVSFLTGGFLLLGIIIAPAMGGMTAQLALQLTGRRRGRYSGYVCSAGVLAGGLLAGFLFAGLGIFTFIYLALATSAAYARFKISI